MKSIFAQAIGTNKILGRCDPELLVQYVQYVQYAHYVHYVLFAQFTLYVPYVLCVQYVLYSRYRMHCIVWYVMYVIRSIISSHGLIKIVLCSIHIINALLTKQMEHID